MSSIVIRVSAAVDQSVDVAYEPILRAAERTAKRVNEALNRGNKANLVDVVQTNHKIAKSFDVIVNAAKRAGGVMKSSVGGAIHGGGAGGGFTYRVSDAERAARKVATAQERAEKEGVRAAERAEKEKLRIRERAERENHAIRMRHFREQQREEERIARQRAREERAAERRKKAYDALPMEEKFRRLERAAGIASGPKSKLPSTATLMDRVNQSQAAFGEASTAFSDHAWMNTSVLRREAAQRRRAARWKSTGRILGGVGGAVGTAAGFAGRAGLDFARDVGVETDFGRMTAQNIALEKNAQDIANSGYMPGQKGANGQRQSTRGIMADAREAGGIGAFSANSALEGLGKFVAKTGDLETGRNTLPDMSKYARATGTDLEDIVDAAGDVNNALGDVANKPELMKGVMRSIIAQGKEGAVEIKDLATQMAKLGSAATLVSGDKSVAVSSMGALAQMTRAKGGAASATQAATSVGSLMATFTKSARINAFNQNKVALRESDGMLRNPMEIIKDAIHNTKGDAKKLASMFADQGAQRVVRGWTSIYNEAGGGKAGDEAVAKEMDHLLKATMSLKEIDASYGAAMNTTEARIQKLNNELSKVADEASAKLLPALLRLSPQVVQLAEGMSKALELVLGVQDDNADKSDDALMAETNQLRTEISQGVKRQEEAGANNWVEQESNGIDPKKLERLSKNQAELAKRAAIRTSKVSANAEAARKGEMIGKFGDALDVAGLGSVSPLGPMLGRVGKPFGAITRGTVTALEAVNEATGGGRAGIGGRAIDENRAIGVKDSSDASATLLRELISAMTSGRVKVEVTNQPNGGPTPTVDGKGRSPTP